MSLKKSLIGWRRVGGVPRRSDKARCLDDHQKILSARGGSRDEVMLRVDERAQCIVGLRIVFEYLVTRFSCFRLWRDTNVRVCGTEYVRDGVRCRCFQSSQSARFGINWRIAVRWEQPLNVNQDLVLLLRMSLLIIKLCGVK